MPEDPHGADLTQGRGASKGDFGKVRRPGDAVLFHQGGDVAANLAVEVADQGGVANVPGVLMKQNEQTRGVPLAGLAVKVTNGFFLIGLSSVEVDRQRLYRLVELPRAERHVLTLELPAGTSGYAFTFG